MMLSTEQTNALVDAQLDYAIAKVLHASATAHMEVAEKALVEAEKELEAAEQLGV